MKDQKNHLNQSYTTHHIQLSFWRALGSEPPCKGTTYEQITVALVWSSQNNFLETLVCKASDTLLCTTQLTHVPKEKDWSSSIAQTHMVNTTMQKLQTQITNRGNGPNLLRT